MQEGLVRGIDTALVALHVVAFVQPLGGQCTIERCLQEIVSGQERRLARAEIGKDDAGRLLARIGGMANFLVECAPGWLARLLQAAPIPVVQPTVINAA